MLVLEREREANSMQDVIERLRLSKQTKGQEIVNEGRWHGGYWAKQHAGYDELWRMAQVALWDPEEHKGVIAVYEEVTGREEPGPEELANFYLIEEHLVDLKATHKFVAGFIEGATAVWDEVKDKL